MGGAAVAGVRKRAVGDRGDEMRERERGRSTGSARARRKEEMGRGTEVFVHPSADSDPACQANVDCHIGKCGKKEGASEQ